MDIMMLARQVAQNRAAAIARLRPVSVEAHQKAGDIKSQLQGSRDALSIQQKTNELLRYGIPSFFPTPQSLASRMCTMADLHSDMTVLEPSAGTGNIADEIRKCGCEPVTVEINHSLADVLRSKGYNPYEQDFLAFTGTFDRVIMNPPFEQMQDVDHVRHAYDLLNTDGVLVAIMSPSPFVRSDRKAVDFRIWFDNLDGDTEELPAGTFAVSGTQVNARLVTMRRNNE